MSECQFDHVVVIGYGVVTGEVLKTVYSLASKYGYTYEYIEHEVHPFNAQRNLLKQKEFRIIFCKIKRILLDILKNY